eukprot:SAG11_NODE_11174_length_779_cov_0.735294_1_plen_215_part_10
MTAQTGRAREDYSAAILGPIKLLDELVKLGYGNVALYGAVRRKAWQWMMDGPMETMWWCAYFEDVGSCSSRRGNPPVCRVGDDHNGGWENTTMAGNNSIWFPCNYNQYSPMETARYMLANPLLDQDSVAHAHKLVAFVTWALVENIEPREPGYQWGARAVSEQRADQNRMVSHTSRYASVLAALAQKTRNASLGRIARRSWDWASYMSNAGGRVV